MKNNNEQFTQIPNSLMSNKDLTDQDKLTLGLILSWVENNKECFMGNEYIAERMGISKNAASIRIKRLEKIGCIKLRYTYKEGKKEVDKRYIILLSLTPEVSSHRRDVSSDRQEGIVPQTMGYRPADEGVSSKLGGIKQPLLDNVLNNVLDKLPNKQKSVELSSFEKEQLLLVVNDINAPERVLTLVKNLITDGPGFLTRNNKELILQHKNYFNKGKLLPKVLEQIF
jgi:DNA-binding Lrp family transcriptional regulator